MNGSGHAHAEGGCTCGTVRYSLTRAPLIVHCCHCTWCQRETGSAFAVNIMIETSAVVLVKGKARRETLPSASGKGQILVRCPDCGVTLWSHYAGAGEAIAFVRSGTLDTAMEIVPDIHIFTSTKRPWVILPDDLPAVPEYYRAADHWPAESIARYKAARNA